jgi:hypothetical protein
MIQHNNYIMIQHNNKKYANNNLKSIRTERIKLLNSKEISSNVYNTNDIPENMVNNELLNICDILEAPNRTDNTDISDIKFLLSKCIGDILNNKITLDYFVDNRKIETALNHGIKINNNLENLSIINSENQVLFATDIHGNANAMKNILYHMFTVDKNRRILELKHDVCFVGDYCDRGIHAFHILLIVICLQSLFPKNITILRGNHEDICYWFYTFGFDLKCFSNILVDCNIDWDQIKKNKDIIELLERKILRLSVICGYDHNDWGNESLYYNTLFCIYKLMTKQTHNGTDDFYNLLKKIDDLFRSFQIGILYRIGKRKNNHEDLSLITILAVHGNIPDQIIHDCKDIIEIIDIINRENRKKTSLHEQGFKKSNIWDIIWNLMRTEMSNDPFYEITTKCHKNKIYHNRSNSYLSEYENFDKHDTFNHGNRKIILRKQTTYFCIKYGIDFILRGHEVKRYGFEFTHPRAITIHSRGLIYNGNEYKGSFCIINNDNIDFIQFSHKKINSDFHNEFMFIPPNFKLVRSQDIIHNFENESDNDSE